MAITSIRYPAFGKYCTTEFNTTVSKTPCGTPPRSSAAWTRRCTRSTHGSCRSANRDRKASIVGAEKSVPQYSSQCGANCESNSPVPTPISSTRAGPSSRIRATVAARHSRMCSRAMGFPGIATVPPPPKSSPNAVESSCSPAWDASPPAYRSSYTRRHCDTSSASRALSRTSETPLSSTTYPTSCVSVPVSPSARSAPEGGFAGDHRRLCHRRM